MTNKTKSLFITATGTDIGKTYVSGLIVKKMRDCGFNCGYFKPVLSGAYKCGEKLIPGDCEFVVKTANLVINPMDCLSYCFEEAVSPHLASERKGIIIETDKIIKKYESLSEQYDYILTEGAGGITCPIRVNNGKYYLMSDLIKDLNQKVLIIADGGLGTINSVLTTVEYIKNRNIEIKGIILNNFDRNNFMHQDNLKMVEDMTEIKVVATVQKEEKELNVSKTDIERLFE